MTIKKYNQTFLFSILANQRKPNWEAVFKKFLTPQLFHKTIDAVGVEIVIDQNFVQHLVNMEKWALIVAKGINFEEETDWTLRPNYQDRVGHCINKINKYAYLACDDEEYDFLYLTVDMLMALLKYHPANNGNKRFAMCFLKVFLAANGYYLQWNRFFGINKNSQTITKVTEKAVEEKIVEFAIKLQNKTGSLSENDEKLIRAEIYDWLTNNMLPNFDLQKCSLKKSNQALLDYIYSDEYLAWVIADMKKQADWFDFVQSMQRLSQM